MQIADFDRQSAHILVTPELESAQITSSFMLQSTRSPRSIVNIYYYFDRLIEEPTQLSSKTFMLEIGS